MLVAVSSYRGFSVVSPGVGMGLRAGAAAVTGRRVSDPILPSALPSLSPCSTAH